MKTKRAKDPFDWNTEELDNLDTKMVKSLNKSEYAIFRWGRGSRTSKGSQYFAYGFATALLLQLIMKTLGII